MKRVANWVPSYIKKAGAFRFFKGTAAAAAAKSLQSCLTLCDPLDGSPPGFSVPGILQARILEWVAISFSKIYARLILFATFKKKISLSVMSQLFGTLCTVACQTSLSMGLSRQEYWSGLPFHSPGDLSRPGIKPMSPASVGEFFTAKPSGKPRPYWVKKLA